MQRAQDSVAPGPHSIVPPQFYATQRGERRALEPGTYDFPGPDRQIAAFARTHGTSLLSLADWLPTRKTTTDGIRPLSCSNGSSHCTPAGHRLCAPALLETFYPKDQP